MIASTSQKSLYTAEVRAPDGVRFAVRAEAPAELSEQLVKYIVERCDHVLWPADAREVRSLIDDGRYDAAIELYFDRVGDRWDEEELALG